MRPRAATAVTSLVALALLAGGCGSHKLHYPESRHEADADLNQNPTTRPFVSRPVADGGTDPAAPRPGILRQLKSIFVDLPVRLYENATGNTPFVAARAMEDADFPDERRKGINGLVRHEYGRRAPYTTRYEQVARTDADWMVRASAIRALNRSRDANATGAFIAALADPQPQVRLEACKALANVPDPAAGAPLLKLIGNPDEPQDVRIAAADAARHYRSLEVARALVGLLPARDFGISWQARRSLRYMTGQDLRYDENAWLTYLTGPAKPFG